MGRRLIHLFACAVLLGVVACETTPVKEEPLRAIDYAEVFRLADEALTPIANLYVERGDRVVLVAADQFHGSTAWRFVPVTREISKERFEQAILPAAKNAFRSSALLGGEGAEVSYLRKMFGYDAANQVYTLKTGADDYDEERVGMILSRSGYAAVQGVDLAAFVEDRPYFPTYFEGGLVSAITRRQGKGSERLGAVSMDAEGEAAYARGEIVFNTNMLNYQTWKEVEQKLGATKLLSYSINSVVESGVEYIGFQVGFRLVDVRAGGKVLWEGLVSKTSKEFPAGKLALLGGAGVVLPEQVQSGKAEECRRKLVDEGVEFPLDAVLVKTDDIAVFGRFPMTREDYYVEQSLAAFFSSIKGVNVLDKLAKRPYKTPWQLAHAVSYMNPLMGGDYSAFPSYYGARYMISYRVLWKGVYGLEIIPADGTFDLTGHILGVSYRIADMQERGRIVVSDFIPYSAEGDLEESYLYRCYTTTRDLEAVATSLAESGVLSQEMNTVLVNRRMEITEGYVGERTLTDQFMLNKVTATSSEQILDTYREVYRTIAELERPAAAAEAKSGAGLLTRSAGQGAQEEACDEATELRYLMAAALMQSWFEEGLVASLVDGGVPVNEKLESLYARYLLSRSGMAQQAAGQSSSEDLLYLSPLLLSQWGSSVKTYLGIDRILYYSLLESRSPSANHIKVPPGCRLGVYFPVVSADPDSMLVSVVDVTSGDYAYDRNFALGQAEGR